MTEQLAARTETAQAALARAEQAGRTSDADRHLARPLEVVELADRHRADVTLPVDPALMRAVSRAD